jgi:hypothetical protein
VGSLLLAKSIFPFLGSGFRIRFRLVLLSVGSYKRKFSKKRVMRRAALGSDE